MYMKKRLLSAALSLFLLTGLSRVSAQSYSSGTDYKNALGMGVDFGHGATLFGVSGKHFFWPNHVGQGEILFGNREIFISLFYQFHRELENAPGLRWFLGGGGTLDVHSKFSDFSLRPMAGLDYKINNIPLNLSIDWRPGFQLTHNSDVEAGRFGFGFRYTFTQ